MLSLADATGAIESTLRFELKMERAAEDGQVIVDRVRGGEALINVAVRAGARIMLVLEFGSGYSSCSRSPRI